MIIISIDASTTSSGWAVFQDDNLIAHGCIKPKAKDWRDRIMEESVFFMKLIQDYNPDAICAEAMPLKPGSHTLETLGAVHGMLLCLCAGYKIKPVFLLPSKWRKAVGLYDGTRAGLKREVLKEKAIIMANEKFDLNLKWYGPKSKKSEDDEAEAILIGLSQIISQNHD
nr:MAG TPA: RuvC [Caudoviricetes sp.]